MNTKHLTLVREAHAPSSALRAPSHAPAGEGDEFLPVERFWENSAARQRSEERWFLAGIVLGAVVVTLVSVLVIWLADRSWRGGAHSAVGGAPTATREARVLPAHEARGAKQFSRGLGLGQWTALADVSPRIPPVAHRPLLTVAGDGRYVHIAHQFLTAKNA